MGSGTIGIVSVLTIVYSGVQISTSGSDSENGCSQESYYAITYRSRDFILVGINFIHHHPGFFTG